MHDYTEAFKKPFTDFRKLAIGLLLSIIPIVNWIALGYFLECSGVKKSKQGMPEWKNLGVLFVNGFFVFLIGIVYMIPSVFLLLVGAGAALLGLASAYVGDVIPVETLKGFLGGTAEPYVLQSLIQNNWQIAIPTLLATAPFLIAAFILAIIAKYLIPIAALRFFETGKFGEAFNLNLVFKKAFNSQYFVAVVIAVATSIVVGTIVGFIPFVGWAAAGFIIGVISYTLFGAAYKGTKK